jgi:hypothetical protein
MSFTIKQVAGGGLILWAVYEIYDLVRRRKWQSYPIRNIFYLLSDILVLLFGLWLVDPQGPIIPRLVNLLRGDNTASGPCDDGNCQPFGQAGYPRNTWTI